MIIWPSKIVDTKSWPMEKMVKKALPHLSRKESLHLVRNNVKNR